MTAERNVQTRRTGRTPVQLAALIFGIVFLLVGILGFIPGITSNYDQLAAAGHHSEAMLLGVFQVSILHNIVHLLFGVAGLVMARSVPAARNYLIWGGVIYLVLWLYGLFIDQQSAANFVPLNTADNWLHFILGVAMLALGLLLVRGRAANPRGTTTGRA
jgi:type II secretory pathway component PulF